MTQKEKTLTQAEALVRDVLSKHFNQLVDAETVRTAAERVAKAIPQQEKEAA